MDKRQGNYVRTISLLLMGLLAGYAAAAQGLMGTLMGAVLDSVSRQPVAYATIALLPDKLASKPLTGTITDAQGLFTLPKLASGTFRLQVSFVGYTTHLQTVTVTADTTELAAILLAPAAQRLGEAVVVGTKSLVDVKADRLVYNADQDVGNAGGTAADVLRKTPLLAVDGEGNVTMRGSANFKVLVNNKPSPTLAQNLAQALKGIPADQIQRVEVITTPSAKDDGEGTAGLVNIVLKKGARRNVNGRLGASGGNRASEVTSALGFKRGKVGFNAAASTGRWHEPDQLTRRRLGFTSLGTDTLTQSGRRQNTGTWYNGTLALDYDPAAHHSFSLLGTLSGYRAQGQRDLANRFVSPDTQLNQLFTRATAEYTSNFGTELTGTYTRTFSQTRREWSVLGQYARNAGTFGYDVDQYLNSAVALGLNQADYRERSRGRLPSQEVTAQTDFTQPLGEKNTLAVGLKAIFRHTGSVATVDGLTPSQAPNFTPLADRSTDFSYAQHVQAVYASYAFAAGQKWAATLGSRLERTALAADFRANGTALPARSYHSLLPNGSLRYAFKSDTSSLRLAYSRRITRPSIDYLNPFVDRSNPQSINYGNPDLTPELTDAYEVSYNTIVRAATVVLSGSVRHTGNAIESVRLPTSAAGVTAQTYANVAATTFYQLTAYGTAKPTPKLDVSGGPTVQYLVWRSPEMDIVRRGFTAGISVDTSYHFARKLTAQASLSGSLPAPTLQGQGSANLYYAVGVKKAILGDQADLTLNLTNPFNDSFPNRSSTTTAFVDERTEYRTYPRAFRLSFNYRFGQEGPERERRKANNDDLKGGK